jgi:uroporphyrinogen III methyltransferase/synthase
VTQVGVNAGRIEAGKPLSGRRIVVTRARAQASAFVRALENLGAEAIEFPTIEIVPPESNDALDRALKNLAAYDWIIFTSVNGVGYFSARMTALKRDLAALKNIRVAAIGPETAKAVESLGVESEVVPEEFRAEAILEKLRPAEMRGKKILVPRAAEARDVLIETLRQWGATVDAVAAYRTIPARGDAGSMRALFERGAADMVTFTSSSTVKNFAALFAGVEARRLLAQTAIACIGPITQETAEEMGIRVDVVSKEYTIGGLTKAIVEYFKRQQASGNRH